MRCGTGVPANRIVPCAATVAVFLAGLLSVGPLSTYSAHAHVLATASPSPVEPPSPSGAAVATPPVADQPPTATPPDAASESLAPPTATASADLVPAATPTADPPPAVPSPAQPAAADPAPAGPATVPDGFAVTGTILGNADEPGRPAEYLRPGAPFTKATVSQKVRIRFQVTNGPDTPRSLTPAIEVRVSGGQFRPVAEDDVPGRSFYLVQEWLNEPGGGQGTLPAEVMGPITAADFLLDPPGSDVSQTTGVHSMGRNPADTIAMDATGVTEVEFTVAASSDAQFDTTYEFRLLDGQEPIDGGTARIVIGPRPPIELSPGQRMGRVVPDAEAAVRYALVAGGGRGAAARYPLVAGKVASTSSSVTAVPAATTGIDPVHGPYTMTTDSCATCHRTHTAAGRYLSVRDGAVSALCFLCHDGLGATSNVKAQYATGPANDPAQRQYFTHDALAVTNHEAIAMDEFGGRSNRHSECTDCHNPHKASSTSATQGATGWTVSGRITQNSGVQVTNGAAGQAPAYTFLDGDTTSATLEYQLCFKCHSGYTTLPSNTGFQPTQYALDKGIEFNPANPSYHPVEAIGKNNTGAMGVSLGGTSPYKLWNFATGSTIRCTHCHASSSVTSGGAKPLAGADLPPHTSANRGILIANYQDRVLKSSTAGYAPSDFALCLLCHAEEPFLNQSSAATNFEDHEKHMRGIAGKGNTSQDINTPGAGGGNATCAECHFRIHSTSFPAGTQSLAGSRLVSFSPNVTGVGTGKPTFTKSANGGSCTLTCHGKQHTPKSYP